MPLVHRFPTLMALLLCLTSFSPFAEAKQPNIILVMTDDQGYGDFGATGNQLIRTPHIDAMAKRSVHWEQFYVSPVCSPTRACLMTGRYNHRTKCIDTFKGRSMMATDEVTMAELLQTAGYATGIFGKWHLGDNYPMRPSDQGFAESLVHKGGGIAQPSEPIENDRRYTNSLLFHNNREVASEGYCTDVFFDAAWQFIQSQAANETPFFCYIPLNAPHGPFHDVPETLLKEYQKTNFSPIMVGDGGRRAATQQDTLARIATMITNVDDNLGRLFERLDNASLTQNTIVIFLTDNGPNTRRYAGPFRGKKSELYEGGIRTPLWIQWPGEFKAGESIPKTVAAHIDLMPTLLDACHVELPDNLDGRSLLAKLKDPSAPLTERPLVIQYHRGDVPSRYHSCMVRKGDWKLVHPSGTQTEQFDGTPNWELYNLADDPGETKNLATEKGIILNDLIKTYEAWFDDVSTERADQPGPPYIVIAPEHESPSILTWQDMIDGNWRTDELGYYKLEFSDEGRFDIRFESHPRHAIDKSKPWTAKLQIGEQIYQSDFNPNERLAIFRGLQVPAGKTKLKPWIETEGKPPVCIYHVWISPR